MKIWDFFKGKNKNTNEPEYTLDAQIEKAILEAKINLKAVDQELDILKKNAVEIIGKVFTVPNRFWYEEVSMYEEIKNLPENEQVDAELIKKTTKIIDGYRTQINQRLDKSNFYIHLIAKYIETREELSKQKKNEEKQIKEQTIFDELDKHEKLIESMQTDITHKNKQAESAHEFLQIKEDLKQKEKQMGINKKVFTEINQLIEKLNSTDGDELTNYKQEIDELMDKLSRADND
jgi:hypothetical protein